MNEYDIIYYKNKNKIIAIIPELAEIFLIDASIKELPSKIISDKKLHFDSSKGFIKRSKRVIVITEDCNMACKYCYEGKKIKKNMTSEMISKIVYSLFEEAKSKKQKLCSIAVFGGEPTLAYCQLKKMVNLVRKLEAEYNINCLMNIVSNGKFNRDIADFLIQEFDNIYISFDAPLDIFIEQRGTESDYYQIYENCKYIYRNSDKLNFKIIVTSKGLHRLSEIMDFYDREFLFVPQMYQPVMIDSTNDLYVDYNDFLIAFAKAKYSRITSKIITTSLFKHYPSIKMCNLHARRIIYPDGKIMACHRINFDGLTPSQHIFLLGHINNSLNNDKIENLKMINVNNIDKCTNCFAKYHCAGGCTAIKLFENKNVNDIVSYCDALKKYTLFEYSILLEVCNYDFLNKIPNTISAKKLIFDYQWLLHNSEKYYQFIVKKR